MHARNQIASLILEKLSGHEWLDDGPELNRVRVFELYSESSLSIDVESDEHDPENSVLGREARVMTLVIAVSAKGSSDNPPDEKLGRFAVEIEFIMSGLCQNSGPCGSHDINDTIVVAEYEGTVFDRTGDIEQPQTTMRMTYSMLYGIEPGHADVIK